MTIDALKSPYSGHRFKNNGETHYRRQRVGLLIGRGGHTSVESIIEFIVESMCLLPNKHDTMAQCCFNVGPPSNIKTTLAFPPISSHLEHGGSCCRHFDLDGNSIVVISYLTLV